MSSVRRVISHSTVRTAFTATLLAVALAFSFTTPAHATGNPLPSVDPASSASSTSVLVNKQRPLNPSQYYPSDLVNFRGTGQYLRAEAAASLNTLFTAASAAGKPLTVVSAFRSYQTQVSTYNYYVSQYGEAYASTISARPGYSEHQTGLAVDVGNTYNCGLSTCFGSTPEGQWVAANAWRFGFIVRYPNGYTGTTGYAYEPWHLRYVGFNVASDMRSRSIPTLEQYFAGNPARSAAVKSGADILAVDGGGKLVLYRAGNGALIAVGAISNGWSGFREGHVVDWTGDGVYDIVAVARDGALYLFRGVPGGTFAPAQRIGQGWSGLTLTTGQLRTGQRPGILAYNSAGNLYYYPNTTGGVPAAPQLIGHGWKDATLTLTDFDGDGRADLLARTSAGSLLLYRGTGNGTLGSSRPVGSGWQGVTALVADYGFGGPGTHGVMARKSDGSLVYYGFRMGQWLPPRTVGSGWGSLNIFR
ncbi:D-alanyl-D-alanine carboxypeptidase family protein [Arthrobacter woluwensis]|jgi:zinc D-Ala-D-Ala carboxypeptidase|uniref:D-alanyl-D-alanine carboxypeptidase family protein n=1 Tax=Arthrobacter woluwensis TaxID=156980 RepID=UPI00381FB343